MWIGLVLVPLCGACERHQPNGTQVERCSAAGADWFQISEPEVVDHSLEVGVDFTGGCESHTFRLCWDGELRVDPPNVALNIDHEDHEDDCAAIIYETHSFDLGPLSDVWVAEGNAVPTTLVIELSGPYGIHPDLLEYSF